MSKASPQHLGLLLALLGQKNGLNVGEDTTLGDGDTREKLVQLFIVADGELEMTGNDPRLLVVSGSVPSQLKNFSSQVLHDGSQVHGGTSSHTLSVVSLAEETVDPSHGELKPSPAAAALALSLHLSSLTTSAHDCRIV